MRSLPGGHREHCLAVAKCWRSPASDLPTGKAVWPRFSGQCEDTRPLRNALRYVPYDRIYDRLKGNVDMLTGFLSLASCTGSGCQYDNFRSSQWKYFVNMTFPFKRHIDEISATFCADSYQFLSWWRKFRLNDMSVFVFIHMYASVQIASITKWQIMEFYLRAYYSPHRDGNV